MSRLDELPPDQRAALSLLVRQHKSYADVAAMLGIAEHAVHDRAHVAIVVLAPRQARALTPQDRLEITDYMLGQQPTMGERLRTRTLLGNSEPARAWALELAVQLAPFEAELPDIPPAQSQPQKPQRQPQRLQDLSAAAAVAAATAVASPPGAKGATRSATAGGSGAAGSPASPAVRSSRRGGAILLAGIVVVVVVAVLLLSGGGKKSANSKTSSSAATKTGPTVENQISLKPPPGPKSGSIGVVEVIAEKSKQAFFIEAQHLPESKGFYYAIWLYNSPTSALALSKSPSVGSTHRLAGGSLLPSTAGSYKEIMLTKETTAHPTHPGRVVLRGAFSLTG
ncbi:MAG TPA: sigma-70 region 4 domain-containing protein [Solirubrobacteraceae bacterium]|jgi:hypothetical protein|nr:sigma-70 region 4 domain-containing protein [Solirubrobacteraceae bacterium]